jgi:glycosyltransferase involved in cell wall biosynthesis
MFAPTLGEGGADRIVVTLLQRLDRARFAPSLALVHMRGALLREVPADVPITVLGSRRVLTAGPRLAEMIRRQDPDVVFSAHGSPNTVVAIAHAVSASRARLVLSERSALVRADRSRLRNFVELRAKALAYRRADLVTAVSAGVASELESVLKLSAVHIRVVYNPIVDDQLVARAAEPVDDPWFADRAVPIIVAVGRLVEIKDYPTLIDAFARVRAQRPARLFVLGDGPLRSQLEALVAARGLAGDVRFHGFDPNPVKYMSRATVMLHASRAEGLPGAMIQSIACGTPVVATDCDYGPREVITSPGRGGFLVPVGDAAELARRTLTLLADADLRAQLRRDGLDAVTPFRVAEAIECYADALIG